jgi:transposase
VPASFRVKRYVRPKYGCSKCHGTVVVADLPQAVIEKGIPAAGLLAHVITSKYADHLPLNRLEDILARHGVDISRQTMCGWVAHVADLLKPIHDAMFAEVMASKVIHADDTPVKVLDPPQKKTKQGRVWVYVGDAEHPHTTYDYQPTRKRDGPMRLLKNFKGYLQGDCWKGFNAICGPAGAKKAACFAHARRKFFDAQESDKPRALLALQFVRALYDVEHEGRALAAGERQALRQRESKPILEQFLRWLQAERGQVLPKSPMGQAISYSLSHWADLKRYLDDGDIDIDNNEAERALRPIAVGRRNWTFFGSDEGGARAVILLSLVASCKRHALDPFVYLRDVLERVSTPCPAKDLAPARWKQLFAPAIPAATAPKAADDVAAVDAAD